MIPLLIGDVLRIGVVGEFDGAVLRLMVKDAAARVPDFGALLVDLSLSTPAATSDAREIVGPWLHHLPRRPAAIVCGALALDFANHLALQLASSKDQPTPMVVFDTSERDAALAWCRERAATFRDEATRRRES